MLNVKFNVLKQRNKNHDKLRKPLFLIHGQNISVAFCWCFTGLIMRPWFILICLYLSLMMAHTRNFVLITEAHSNFLPTITGDPEAGHNKEDYHRMSRSAIQWHTMTYSVIQWHTMTYSVIQ